MGRLILLLLIAGGLIVFATQNLSPVALVVLGIRTQALPLSVWVLSFVAAGALTTLLLSGFFSLSKNAAVRKSAQREAKPRSPWTDAKTSAKTSARTSSAADDDWERQSDWEDWTEPPSRPQAPPQARSQPPQSRSSAASRDNIRDTTRDRQPDPRPGSGRSPLEQAGFSRADSRADSRSDSRAEPPRKSNEVYDAEYRVLIPPYSATPPAAPKDAVPPAPTDSTQAAKPDDEDWV